MSRPAPTLGELVDALGGCLVACDAQTARAATVRRLCSIERPEPGGVAVLVDPRHQRIAERFDGLAVVASVAGELGRTTWWVHDAPGWLWAQLAARLHGGGEAHRGVHATAVVDPSARIAASCAVGPGCVVGAEVEVGEGTVLAPRTVVEGQVRIGRDCLVGAGAFIGRHCVLGDRVVVGPNAVIGDQGFGYMPATTEVSARMPHVGGVVIEDDVHVGAGTCIDAGTFEPTRVGQGTHVDNLVHLAHNVQIGRRCVIMAQVGVAGSTVVEDGCILAGQVGVAEQRHIGAGARVAAQGGVAHDVPAGASVAGSPALELARWRRTAVALKALPERVRQLDALRTRVARLEERAAGADAVQRNEEDQGDGLEQ